MKLRGGLVLALVVLFLDQISKVGIVEWIKPPPAGITLTGFFSIVLVWNRGMSFGMLNTGAAAVPWILGGLTIVVAVALIWWLARTQRWLMAVGIGLVLGGALGNLIDRLVHGAVVDFLLLHAGRWQWPAFNLADSAITIGVAALLWDSLFTTRESPK
jgi:signal peptidase II